MKKKLALLAGIVAAMAMAVAPAQASAWTVYDQDTYGFWDRTGSRVAAYGTANWARSPSWVHIRVNHSPLRVKQFHRGCLFVRVNYNKIIGSVSWPPSGTVGSTSDGWLRRCLAPGSILNLDGLGHPASAALVSTTVCIGFAPAWDPTIRRHDACQKVTAGYG